MASGGLDGSVKIWDTHTISQFQAFEDSGGTDFSRILPPESQQRPLCSMSRHNGVVTCVKFSPDGRFLASGSDDKIVLIWEKDDILGNQIKRFGDSETDSEHWTVRKRLVAHDNDIQDICWNPDGSLLVTVGLDRLIMIWSGTTFERIKRYDVHQSMVKGIVFDPANKFFATASDDRTVRIFRYSKKIHELASSYEFQIEHVVFDPFKKSPLTSYFRRMSWSPDGQNIAVPNATNGTVPSVAIIKRGNWSSDVSLIGHEAPCEVCSFSPKLFQSPDTPEDEFHTILATGGQDRTLAIWSTKQSVPLVVAEEIVGGSITDICWDVQGESLYFSCTDGTISCIYFDAQELGVPVSSDTVNSQLHKYGRDRESNIFPESIELLKLEETAKKQEMATKKETTKKQETRPLNSREASKELATKEVVQVEKVKPSNNGTFNQKITMKNGKKRVAPQLVSGHQATNVIELPKTVNKLKPNTKLSHSNYLLPRLGLATTVNGLKLRVHDNLASNQQEDNDNHDMNIELPTEATNLAASTLRNQKRKLNRHIMESRYPYHFKLVSNLSGSLFNHSVFIQHEMSQIINSHDFENAMDLFSGTSATADTNDEDVIFAVIVKTIDHVRNPDYCLDEVESQLIPSTGVRSIIEVRNGSAWDTSETDEIEYDDTNDFQDPTTVIVANVIDGEFRKYGLFYPCKIQHVLPVVIDDILLYYVLVSFSGTLSIILAESGTLAVPKLEIGNNLVCLKHSRYYLMALTNTGLIYIWKLPILCKKSGLEGVLHEVSLAPIMNYNLVIGNDDTKPIISPDVKAIEIDPESGCPYVLLSDTNDVYKYSIDLMVWVKVIDSWYFNSIKQPQPSTMKLMNYFNHLSFTGFQDDVKRAKIGRYIHTPETEELVNVMHDRYNEMNDCIC